MRKQVDRRAQAKFFCKKFGVNEEALEAFRKFYNSDFSSYDNHVYEDVLSRVVHWWNFEDGDWFSERIRICLDYIASCVQAGDDVLLVDVGYSVPYMYTRDELVKSNARALFIDKEESAAKFFTAIAEFEEISRSNDVALTCDIEQEADRVRAIEKLSLLLEERSPDRVLIVASEVIEHLDEPDSFWRFASSVKEQSSANQEIYVTLPVGKKIPSHTMEFLTIKEAMDYLSQYMDVNQSWSLHPPGEGSEFLAECLCALGRLRTNPDR